MGYQGSGRKCQTVSKLRRTKSVNQKFYKLNMTSEQGRVRVTLITVTVIVTAATVYTYTAPTVSQAL